MIFRSVEKHLKAALILWLLLSFFAGLAWDLSYERSAQIGSLLATYVIETVGTQEYELAQRHFLARFSETYGQEAAAQVAAHIRCPRP